MKLLIIIELIVISFRSINMSIINKFIKFTKLFKSKIWRIGILNNIAANIELENLVKNLDFNTVLDIGSNKGQFILLIENFYKDIIIHSFEPIKELIEKQKNFFKFKKNIFFYNIGVGKKSTKKNFFITKRKDSSSFLKADNIKIKDYNIAEEREINIKSLDEIMLNKELVCPILVKIDVQGYELEVLKGGNDFFKKIKYLIIEVSENEIYSGQSVSKEIIQYLENKNFIILKENLSTQIVNTHYMQRDILFVNKLI